MERQSRVEPSREWRRSDQKTNTSRAMLASHIDPEADDTLLAWILGRATATERGVHILLRGMRGPRGDPHGTTTTTLTTSTLHLSTLSCALSAGVRESWPSSAWDRTLRESLRSIRCPNKPASLGYDCSRRGHSLPCANAVLMHAPRVGLR